jgi:hypothetical protein
MEFAVVSLTDAGKHSRSNRGAMRYPMHLRVTLVADGHDYQGVTEDLSASGVLLRLDQPLPTGQDVEFLVEIPSGVLESSVTAALHCSGRIVRSYWKDGEPMAAAVIDEYRFQ